MLEIPFDDVEVCMLTRNEEALLETTLPPLVERFSKFSILDQSSSDRTREILKDILGNKAEVVVEDDGYLREIGFAGARNKVSQMATRLWLLHIDADERIAFSDVAVDIHADADPMTEYLNVSRRNIAPPAGCSLPLTSKQILELPVELHEKHVRLYRNQCGINWRSFIHEELWQNGRRTLHEAPDASLYLDHLQKFKLGTSGALKEQFYGWMMIRGASRSRNEQDALSEYSNNVLNERKDYFDRMAQEFETIVGVSAQEDSRS